jgi:hypothetical protein
MFLKSWSIITSGRRSSSYSFQIQKEWIPWRRHRQDDARRRRRRRRQTHKILG